MSFLTPLSDPTTRIQRIQSPYSSIKAFFDWRYVTLRPPKFWILVCVLPSHIYFGTPFSGVSWANYRMIAGVTEEGQHRKTFFASLFYFFFFLLFFESNLNIVTRNNNFIYRSMVFSEKNPDSRFTLKVQNHGLCSCCHKGSGALPPEPLGRPARVEI